MPYDFTIDWRSGSTNLADAPLRRLDYMALEGDDKESLGLLGTLRVKIARV